MTNRLLTPEQAVIIRRKYSQLVGGEIAHYQEIIGDLLKAQDAKTKEKRDIDWIKVLMREGILIEGIENLRGLRDRLDKWGRETEKRIIEDRDHSEPSFKRVNQVLRLIVNQIEQMENPHIGKWVFLDKGKAEIKQLEANAYAQALQDILALFSKGGNDESNEAT